MKRKGLALSGRSKEERICKHEYNVLLEWDCTNILQQTASNVASLQRIRNSKTKNYEILVQSFQ